MIYDNDQWLLPFKDAIDLRKKQILSTYEAYAGGKKLSDVMNNHLFYGLHRTPDSGWVFREWAPNANRIYLIC